MSDQEEKKDEQPQDLLLGGSRLSQAPKNQPASATSAQKWWASFLLGILFVLISSPVFYGLTSSVSMAIGFRPLAVGGPSIFGLVIHGVIFILILMLILF